MDRKISIKRAIQKQKEKIEWIKSKPKTNGQKEKSMWQENEEGTLEVYLKWEKEGKRFIYPIREA